MDILKNLADGLQASDCWVLERVILEVRRQMKIARLFLTPFARVQAYNAITALVLYGQDEPLTREMVKNRVNYWLDFLIRHDLLEAALDEKRLNGAIEVECLRILEPRRV